MCSRGGKAGGCTDTLQACKDKKSVLLESMDTVKLSYSQLTAQTAELTQQVLHMTSHVQSQVRLACLLCMPVYSQAAKLQLASGDSMHAVSIFV